MDVDEQEINNDNPNDSMSIPPWVLLSSQLAPYASALVFVAPVPTIRKIMRDRSIGGLPLLPYSSMVANCFIWLVYGLLVNETIVWQTNALGLGLGLLYCNEFRKYCPPPTAGLYSTTPNSLPGTVQDHWIAVSSISLLTGLGVVLLPKPKAASLVGFAGVLLCILMFASPLAKLRDVIQSKSAKSIPLPFTLTSLLNCFLWSIVGWFKLNDSMIYIPNFLGLSFATIQLSLKLYCRRRPVSHDKEAEVIELIASTSE
jgi:solute carrier family 50 protein (sugar transporter)